MKAFILHTVRPGLNTFEGLLREQYPDLTVYNILDDCWSRELVVHGALSEEFLLHLLNICQDMQHTGVDIIICTCSSLTPYVPRVQPFLSIPLVAIDATMAENALKYGSNILIVATADSAIESAVTQVRIHADAVGMACRIASICCDDAGQIMRDGKDLAEHDKILLERLRDIRGYDVLILAQLSTAHLAEQIQHDTGIPVLTTPGLCIADLKKYLAKTGAVKPIDEKEC